MPPRETPLTAPEVLRLYRDSPASVRLHVQTRWRLFPFPALARLAPAQGILVDLGCGHGLWAFTLALQHPQAQVWGVDPDLKRIEAAGAIARAHHLGNVRFSQGLAEAAALPEDCALVSLIDVLYLIPPEGQDRLLEQIARRLKPGGRLLLKEMDERLRWKFAWNWFEEFLAVQVLHITHGRRSYFRPAAEWEALLRRLGLRVETRRLDAGYPYPHLLFIAERPAC